MLDYYQSVCTDFREIFSSKANDDGMKRVYQFADKYGLDAAKTMCTIAALYYNPMEFAFSTRVLTAITLTGLPSAMFEYVATYRWTKVNNTIICTSVMGNALVAVCMPQYYSAFAATLIYQAAFAIDSIAHNMLTLRKNTISGKMHLLAEKVVDVFACSMFYQGLAKQISSMDCMDKLLQYVTPEITANAAILSYHLLIDLAYNAAARSIF